MFPQLHNCNLEHAQSMGLKSAGNCCRHSRPLQYYTKATIIRLSRVKVLILWMLAHQKVFATLSGMEPLLIVINETCVYLFFHVNMAALKKVHCFCSLKWASAALELQFHSHTIAQSPPPQPQGRHLCISTCNSTLQWLNLSLHHPAPWAPAAPPASPLAWAWTTTS